MKKLSLRFKLYALVISLLLVMGISIVVTAQISPELMEQRITAATRDTVRNLAIDRLSATAGKYGEVVSGMFSTAYRTPEVVRNVISRNIQADSSGRIGDAANDLRAVAQRGSGSGRTLDEQVKVLDSELSRLKT